jgi:hypothetical protein
MSRRASRCFVLVAATLLAATACSAAPAVSIGELASRPLDLQGSASGFPTACTPAEAGRSVVRFLAGLSAGDVAAVRAALAGDEDLRWLSSNVVPSPSGFSSVDVGADIDAYVLQRHAMHEQIALDQMALYYRSGLDVDDIEFFVWREADDLPRSLIRGKGSLGCEDGKISLWSFGSPGSGDVIAPLCPDAGRSEDRPTIPVCVRY